MAFRTQKISQMTPKGADLEATDLIEVSTIESGSYVTRSITGQELIDAIPPTTIEWGDIGGTLSNQTDLQSALDAKVPTTRTLTINGTTQDLSADRTFTISTGITIGTTAIASGTVGRVLFQGTGNVVQQSSSLFWDNTGFLGIGTSTPVAPSTYNGITINSATAGSYVWFQTGGVTKYTVGSESNVNYHNLVAGTSFLIRSGGSSYFNVVQSTGNVQIGTTTDAGFRLDVNGTARVSGLLTTPSGTNLAGWYLYANGTSLASIYGGSNWVYTVTSGGSHRFLGGNLLINTTTDAGFRLDVNGTARVSSNLTVSGTLVANLLRAANLNESMILYQRRTATSGDGFSLFDNNVVNGSNININILNIGGSYGTSGTCVHNNLLISREINLASGTQTVRGIYYNPTLTNTTGLTTHYAIHTAVGRIRFENLPTSSAGLSAGELWNNLGVLMIV